MGWGKSISHCYICDREDVELYTSFPPRCVDQETCFKLRKRTRIVTEKDLKFIRYKHPYKKEIKDQIWHFFPTFQTMQMADFVVYIDKQGGVEFIKDRYEDTVGKKFFAY